MNTKREIHYIDVGSMSRREVCGVIDGVKNVPVGTTYNSHMVYDLSFIGLGIMFGISAAFHLMLYYN